MKFVYIKSKVNNVVNISQIVTIHYYEFDKTFNFTGEKHDFWEMVYVDGGMVEITRDGETLLLKQGDVIFHQPDEFHTIRSYNSSPNVVVVTFVCKSPLMEHLKKYTTRLGDLKSFIASVISEANDTYVIPKNDIRYSKLVVKSTAPVGGEQLIKSYLEQLLILLIRKLTKKSDLTIFPSKEKMETPLVLEIKKFIKSRVGQDIKVQDICDAFNYSKTYLSRVFKEQTSRSLAEYFNVCKVEEAKRLIRENNCNYAQISDMLAFDNPQYFSRVFKRMTGLTPSAFRASLEIAPADGE